MTKVAKGKRLKKILLSRVKKAVRDFSMVEEGDKIAVGLSGGKDSYSLLLLLNELKKQSLVKFELIALTAHNGNKFFEWEKIKGFTEKIGVPFHLEKTEIIDIVKEKLRPSSYPCAFCARLRRAYLYNAAISLGCNKLALGHHLDDAIETVLINFFFQGCLKGMPPKLLAENRKVVLIRPLYYIPEIMIKQLSKEVGYPTIDCACFIACDKQGERMEMKKMVEEVSKRYPKARMSALKAMMTILPRYLADKNFHNFDEERIKEEE